MKNMNPKNSKKSPIHENADANITCDFDDGDISRSRSFLSNTCDRYTHTYIASSIIGRLALTVINARWRHQAACDRFSYSNDVYIVIYL